MILFNTIVELQKHLNSIRKPSKIVGLVPTMGALHKGHVSLVEAAKAQCDIIVASIFVNPTQFNDLNDLSNYPKTMDADCQLLQKSGCDILFAPEIDEMYSTQELNLKRQQLEDRSWTNGIHVDFGLLDKVMEGAHRPGHFNGVAQVVSKLFRIVKPDMAYFGQKDFQQLAIIKSMVNQLALPVEIIMCPIVREPDGLAMSSRNMRLTVEERKTASLISKILFKIKELSKTKTISELKSFAEAQIGTEPKMRLDYFEIVNAETLQPITDFSQADSATACIAVVLETVRLIDNVILKE
ncbi:MAG: pantoate--beta-alanine ligase [Bacteroidetes bacterium]|nr:pantoate--beta-alanine ligase [Bacteroidota bacterium]